MSRETISALLWLIPAMLCCTTGELFFKRGINEIGSFDFATVSAIVPTLVKIALNPYIWVGMLGFVGSSVFWLSVISRAPLSLAYPMLSLSYVIVVIESWIFLNEGLHPLRVIGSPIIVAGVGLVSLSGGEV